LRASESTYRATEAQSATCGWVTVKATSGDIRHAVCHKTIWRPAEVILKGTYFDSADRKNQRLIIFGRRWRSLNKVTRHSYGTLKRSLDRSSIRHLAAKIAPELPRGDGVLVPALRRNGKGDCNVT
jgi:hypothetical protein